MTPEVMGAPPPPVASELSGPAEPVPSPCVNVCRMEPGSGLCEGCLRTLDEIAAWSQLDDGAKRVVWSRLHERRAARSLAALRSSP